MNENDDLENIKLLPNAGFSERQLGSIRTTASALCAIRILRNYHSDDFADVCSSSECEVRGFH